MNSYFPMEERQRKITPTSPGSQSRRNIDDLVGKLRVVLNRHRDVAFLAVVYLGLVIRVYLAAFTRGTSDVSIWRIHVSSIIKQGLFNYYGASLGTLLTFNHPPLMASLMVALFKACDFTGLDFGFIYRLVLGMSDFFAALLLLRLLKRQPYRHVAVGLYLLAPVTFLLSSYHGNTDPLVALFALASLNSIAGGGYALAGFLLGLGASVKWVIFLVGPALFFGIPSWQKRLQFSASAALAVLLGYGWWMGQHPLTVFKSVFGYRGQMFFTGAGDPIWGNQITLRAVMRFLGMGDAKIQGVLDVLFQHNGAIILVAVCVFCWLRRRRRAVEDIGATIAGSFCIFYAVTNYWAFQYFAWAVPFYFFLDWKRCFLFVILTSAYIYGLYGYFCGSWLLNGTWDFIGHAHWPRALLALRDLAVLAYILAALDFMRRAVIDCGAAPEGRGVP